MISPLFSKWGICPSWSPFLTPMTKVHIWPWFIPQMGLSYVSTREKNVGEICMFLYSACREYETPWCLHPAVWTVFTYLCVPRMRRIEIYNRCLCFSKSLVQNYKLHLFSCTKLLSNPTGHWIKMKSCKVIRTLFVKAIYESDKYDPEGLTFMNDIIQYFANFEGQHLYQRFYQRLETCKQ